MTAIAAYLAHLDYLDSLNRKLKGNGRGGK